MRIPKPIGLTTLLCLVFMCASAWPQQPTEEGPKSHADRYELANRKYDLESAIQLYAELEQIIDNEPTEARRWLTVKTALLIAELQRIRYEKIPKSDPKARRELGRLVDHAANDGLARINDLPEVSEKYRIQADLLGCTIRTWFRAKKYRKRMESAVERARQLDDRNVLALLTAAKPYLFADEKRGGDFEQAVELLTAALDLNAGNERALILRGFAYNELGETELATKDWEKALSNNRHCEPARNGLERMQSERIENR